MSHKVEIKLINESSISLGISVVTHEDCTYSITDGHLIVSEEDGDGVIYYPYNLKIVSQYKITLNKKS